MAPRRPILGSWKTPDGVDEDDGERECECEGVKCEGMI